MNVKTLGLAVALVLASAVPALAYSNCSEPIPPAAIDGNTATKAQMGDALADVKTFIKQSDDYQICLLREVKEAQVAAVKAKQPFDPAIKADVDAKIRNNQQLKEQVGAEYNAAAKVYNEKHPDAH